MKYGYTRVLTVDQNASLQKDALKSSGCEKAATEQISGTSAKRLGLDKLLVEDLFCACITTTGCGR